MKLLCLSQYPPDLGGIASHVHGLCQGLADQGWQSLVLRPSADTSPAPAPMDDGPSVRVHSVAARYPSEQFEIAYLLQNTQILEGALAAGVAKTSVDLVVCHGSQFALAALSLADALAVPLVYHAHNVYSAPQPDETAFQPGLMLQIEADIASRAAYVIAISDYIAGLCQKLGTDPTRMSVIPKGLHMAQFAGDWRPGPKPVALYVGRLSPEKGLETFFAALAALAESDRPVFALVVGGGEEQYVSKLRRLIGELDLASRVWFAGQVNADRLVGMYQSSSVTVVPSRMEALGRVAIEAMASGCPVVVTDVGGLGPLVEDGVTGWKVPGGDVTALAEAIWAAVADPTEAAARAERARAKVRREFTYEAVIDRTLACYQTVLAGAGR